MFVGNLCTLQDIAPLNAIENALHMENEILSDNRIGIVSGRSSAYYVISLVDIWLHAFLYTHNMLSIIKKTMSGDNND